tara:strand:+ start:29 stop:214 length:186 start_codon:yes stop_codon:yes gene_type:complete
MGTAYSYLVSEEEEESRITNLKWKSITKHIDKTHNYSKNKNRPYYFVMPDYEKIELSKTIS